MRYRIPAFKGYIYQSICSTYLHFLSDEHDSLQTAKWHNHECEVVTRSSCRSRARKVPDERESQPWRKTRCTLYQLNWLFYQKYKIYFTRKSVTNWSIIFFKRSCGYIKKSLALRSFRSETLRLWQNKVCFHSNFRFSCGLSGALFTRSICNLEGLFRCLSIYIFNEQIVIQPRLVLTFCGHRLSFLVGGNCVSKHESDRSTNSKLWKWVQLLWNDSPRTYTYFYKGVSSFYEDLSLELGWVHQLPHKCYKFIKASKYGYHENWTVRRTADKMAYIFTYTWKKLDAEKLCIIYNHVFRYGQIKLTSTTGWMEGLEIWQGRDELRDEIRVMR